MIREKLEEYYSVVFEKELLDEEIELVQSEIKHINHCWPTLQSG